MSKFLEITLKNKKVFFIINLILANEIKKKISELNFN